MTAKLALNYAYIANIILCVALLAMLVWQRSVRKHVYFLVLLITNVLVDTLGYAFLYHRRELGLSPRAAYLGYFYSYWPLAFFQLALQILIIYSVYRTAMKPLNGLRKIGTVIFYWVAAVSLVLSVALAMGPQAQGFYRFANFVGQVQEGDSILTVCLLVFVCFAGRPLGLNFRSREFGVALGLGVNATAGLAISAWFSNQTTHSLYSPVFAAGAVAQTGAFLIWSVYFAMPEPERRLVVLPTTSPYFLWNSISEALGDDPGVVAVAGFTPAMLTPAEMLALTSTQPALPEYESGPMASPAMAAGF